MLSGSLPDGVSGYWLRLYRPQNISSMTALRCARKQSGGTTLSTDSGTPSKRPPNPDTSSKPQGVLQTRCSASESPLQRQRWRAVPHEVERGNSPLQLLGSTRSEAPRCPKYVFVKRPAKQFRSPVAAVFAISIA